MPMTPLTIRSDNLTIPALYPTLTTAFSKMPGFLDMTKAKIDVLSVEIANRAMTAGIDEVVKRVAVHLGEWDGDMTYIFVRGDLRCEWRHNANQNVAAFYKKTSVLNSMQYNDTKFFIPGKWVAELIDAYKEVEVMYAQEIEEARQATITFFGALDE